MSKRSSVIRLLLFPILAVLSIGCSKNDAKKFSSSPAHGQPALGAIVGTVQIALGSGDVKSLAFKPVKLVQENYSVFAESEKQDIVYDVDQGSEALRLGLTSIDEYSRKGQRKVDALRSFEKRLPEKLAIPAVSSATTDAGGNFKFEQIRPGAYWIFIDTEVSGNRVGWATSADVGSNSVTKVDLNNTNLDYGFR